MSPLSAVLLTTLILTSCHAQAEGLLSRVESFQAVQRQAFKLASLEQKPVVRAAFQLHLAHAYGDLALSRATDDELSALLQAADALAFYSQAPEDVDLVHRVLQRLERRGAATDDERAMYFRGLVEVRRFDEARRYSTAHPSMDVEAMPDLVDAMDSTEGPVVYEVAAHSFALRKQRRSLSRGIHLIVVAHPLCRYSRDAMKAIAADRAFAPVLQSHTTWIAPISRWLYFDTLQA